MTRSETEHRRHGNGGDTGGMPAPLFENMPETMKTVFDQSAKLQSELLTLWSHRAQAWLNWPKQMLACKDPTDVVEAEGVFVKTMQRHYREYFDSVMHDVAAHGKDLDPNGGKESETRQTREHSREDRQAA